MNTLMKACPALKCEIGTGILQPIINFTREHSQCKKCRNRTARMLRAGLYKPKTKKDTYKDWVGDEIFC